MCIRDRTNYCYCETHDSRILNEKVNNGILYLGKHCLNVRGRYLGSIKCYIDIGPGIVRTDIYERYGNEIRAIVTEGPGGLDIHSTPQCVFVLPPARGEIVSWETTYGGMDSDYTAQFVDSVSTKHGTLSDVVLVTENTSADGEAISTYRRYYAKGYGLVRTEEDSEGKTNIWPSHELVKFYTKQIR